MFLVAALLPLAAFASSVALPYPDALDLPDDIATRQSLLRLSTGSGISLPRQGWPQTAREAQDFLRQILSKDSMALSSADSVNLRDLLSGPMEAKRWNGISSSMLAINLRSGGEVVHDDSTGSHTTELGWIGGRAYGVLGGEIWFHSDARIFTQWSNRAEYHDFYALADGETSGVPLNENAPGGIYTERTGARYTAWIQWSRDWITLKYGRDHIQHGPGVWTGLTTSWQTPPYQMLDVRVFPFPWLSVQSSTLEAREAGIDGGLHFPGDARKWMHVHRFEIQPTDGLAIAFQNEVLYRDSGGVNPAYLLPLVPIFFSQDLAGNRDNAMMQFDAAWTTRWHTKLWAAFLIDDLNGISDIAGNHWLNRWASLLGAQFVSPWKSLDADLTVEFSQVRPWTYTGGREEAYTFSHYGLPTGSELGPDSRTWHARSAWRPMARLELGLEGSLLEKGIGPQATLGTVNGHWGGFYNEGATLSYKKAVRRSAGIDARAELWRDAYAKLGVTRWSQESDVAGDSDWWQLKATGSVDW
jgi:hypothetical protein